MASVEFYLKHYKNANGAIVDSETLIESVPFDAGMEPVLTNPRIKNEMGKAGSFEFGLERNSPYYDSMLQMKTIVRVVYFGNTIFRGRVLTIDRTMQGSRSIHCEGDFAFLMDTIQDGEKDDARPEIELLEYLRRILAKHNSLADDDHKFTYGELPYKYSDAVQAGRRLVVPNEKKTQKFGSSSFNTTMDRFEDLLSNFGGYWRTRYNESTGTTYLDWLDNYFREYDGRKVEVARNLIDISGTTEVENLFTVVLPIGKGSNSENLYITDWWPQIKSSHARVNYIEVPELATVPLYSDAELNSSYHRKEDYANAISKYGRIWRVVEFENADSPEKLFTYAKDWIKNTYMPELTQWDVSALDLRIVGGEDRPLLVGDRISLTHPEVDNRFDALTIISAEYDLYNPDKNKYKIGVPNQEVNASYGVKSPSKKGGGGGGGGGGISASVGGQSDESQQIEQLRAMLLEQYMFKTEFKQDIGLDDPLAFITYNTNGTEKPEEEIKEELADTLKYITNTRFGAGSFRLSQLAKERGVSINDPQLVIDLNPELKRKQEKWQSDTLRYLTQTVGLSTAEAATLINDSSSSWVIASYVDDDGNWTEEALKKGAAVWNQDFKEAATAVHKIKNGDYDPIGPQLMKDATGFLTSNGINLGNFFNADGIGSVFNFGEILSGFEESAGNVKTQVAKFLDGKGIDIQNVFDTVTEKGEQSLSLIGDIVKAADSNGIQSLDFINGLFKGTNKDGSKTFNLTNDLIDIDGVNGTAKVGKVENDWAVKLNQTVTYTDADGKTQTVSGTVSAKDFNVPEVPSFKSKFAYIEDAIIERATIAQLAAQKAEIEKLVADEVDATKLWSKIVKTGTLRVTNGLTVEGNINAESDLNVDGTAYLTSLSLKNRDVNNIIVNATVSGDTLTLENLSGVKTTFKKPSVNVSVVGEQDGGWMNIRAVDLNNNNAELAKGSVQISGYVSAPYTLNSKIQDDRRPGPYTTNGWKQVKPYPSDSYTAMKECNFQVNVATGGGTCFMPGSMILLADGTEQAIETLTPGTLLTCYDEETKQFVTTEVMSLRQFKHRDDVFRVELDSGRTLLVTDSHPLLTIDGWKAIDTEKVEQEHHHDDITVTRLSAGDRLVSVNGPVTVKSIEYGQDLYDVTVYNLDVEEIDTYIVEGIVAHNADEKN